MGVIKQATKTKLKQNKTTANKPTKKPRSKTRPGTELSHYFPVFNCLWVLYASALETPASDAP